MPQRKFDPFLERWVDESPEYPAWRTSTPTVSREDGTINHAGRAEKFILDQPGRRSGEAGSGEIAEKPRAPKIIGG
jgi:hypothetical protein